jgi:hypothetical protein
VFIVRARLKRKRRTKTQTSLRFVEMAGTWAIFPVMTATNLVATAAVASAKLSKASSAEEALL